MVGDLHFSVWRVSVSPRLKNNSCRDRTESELQKSIKLLHYHTPKKLSAVLVIA
jgi:hypothetical protein